MYSSRKNKILVIGHGSSGQRYIRLIKKNFPKFEIYLLRHRNCSENISGLECFDNYNQIPITNVYASVVANPASLHIEVASKLLADNIPTLIEKPLSDNPDSLINFFNLINEKRSIVRVAYNLRHHKGLRLMKSLIEENFLGKILKIKSIVGQNLKNWRPNIDYRNSVSAQKKLGGGVLLELSHEIDYLIWFFGDIHLVSSHVSKISDLEVDTEDNCIAIFTQNYKDRKIVGSVEMDFFRHDTIREFCIVGSLGTLRLDLINSILEHYDSSNKEWKKISFEKMNSDYTYVEQLKSFLDAVEKNKFDDSDIETSIKIINLISLLKI